MGKRPQYDARIWAEHEASTFYAAPKMSQSERDERAMALYQSCRVDGEWVVGIEDAGLVTTAVVYNALIGARYEGAIELAREFLEHPDLDRADLDRRNTIQKLLGEALVITGEVDAGLSAIAESTRTYVRTSTRRMHTWSALTGVLNSLGESTAVDERFRDFAYTFLYERKASRGAAKKALKASTCGELERLIDKGWRSKR